MPVNPTLFWLVSAAALLYVAVRLLGIEGALLTGMVLLLLHLTRHRARTSAREEAPKIAQPAASPANDLPQGVVHVELGDELDLHAFSPSDVKALVGDYLDDAAAKGLEVVRIIHGKGRGVQRSIVQSLLQKHPQVRSFRDAPPDRGSWGATLVYLKTSEEED